MKGLRKVFLVLVLFCIMGAGMTACGGSKGGGSSADTSYTLWNYFAVETSYYTDFNENPAVQYVLGKAWGPEEKKIQFDFWAPAAGTESDNYQTMVASGDYPDVLNGAIADAAPMLYEQGIIQDLTEYAEQYMPNYLSYIEENPELKPYVYYEVDGKERLLNIAVVHEDYDDYFCGYMYRRDWIVKYGVHPETGEAFTGGYTDAEDVDSWEDNVVFPSGETDPVYISDWEWMFEIFETAQADLGITDSYSISMYYPGYTSNGQLSSSFGGGSILWYKNKEGKVQFGGNSDNIRTYFQCLNTWYDKGWLDQEFHERTGDTFYTIDDVSVRQGKVGMWTGLWGQLGGRLDMGDEWTSGINVQGAALPINDVYGPETCQYIEPDCTPIVSLASTPYYITAAAEKKDMATLLSFFDYFYTEEGAIVRSIGLNEEQIAEVDSTLYQDYGLDQGAYIIAEDGRYRLQDTLMTDSGTLSGAVSASLFPGIALVSSKDTGHAKSYKDSLARWTKYRNSGTFEDLITNNMTNEDTKAINDLQTKILGYMEQKAAEFIRGIADPNNDEEWSTWCTMLEKYNYQKGIEIYQPYVDRYSY